VARSAASAHLAVLGAKSRPTGSRELADARAYCAGVLGGLGFTVREHSFEFSAFAGRWATPLAGLVIASDATLLVHLDAPRLVWVGVAIGVLTLLLVARWSGGQGVVTAPVLRRRGVNLEATRGEAPRVWLVAHLDSKWQPVSMMMRVAGVITLAIALIALTISLWLHLSHASWAVWFVWLGAMPLILSVVGTRNHGTLDNASGIAAVLEAASRIDPSKAVGVLITDAEELALAGARAWTTIGHVPPATALNCDSVDDDGPLVLMYTGSRPAGLVSVLERAATAARQEVRTLRLIPGILTDSIALAAGGWQTLTLSRGTLRTLQRIHTSRDTLATMSGRGISGAAEVLARAATELG
jgi:hypothetical protein